MTTRMEQTNRAPKYVKYQNTNIEKIQESKKSETLMHSSKDSTRLKI